MLLSSSAEQGEIEHDEQEMLYKVFDFADKEVVGRDGAAAGGGRDLDRACRPRRR